VTGLALAVALAAAGAPASAAEVPPASAGRIAVERLRATDVAEALVATVEERLCVAVVEASGAEVVCPADVAAAAQLARQSALLGACTPEECLKRVDALGAAERRVKGTLVRTERGVVLSLALEGPAGTGPRVIEPLPPDLDALVARIPAAVRKLFP
jgi:hypothetical protein